MHTFTKRAILAATALSVAVLPITAHAAPTPTPKASATSELPKLATAPVVRLGFLANVTHAPALVAVQLGLFEKQLAAEGTKVEYTVFNAGPALIEAMKGGAIDVAYIGPNPSVSGFTTTNGSLLKIVSGATSGGAQLVVRPGINSISDLKGKKIATPQLGNTQDVALRAFLKEKGLSFNSAGGGDVGIIPTDNSTILALFKRGDVDGGWLPEPWASRLVLESGAKVLLDEKDIWPGGQFVTTNIIASQKFLSAYPGTIRSVLQANNSAIKWIAKNLLPAKDVVQVQVKKWTGSQLADPVINRAWGNLRFTWDPLPATLKKSADDAVTAGLLNLKSGALNGIYDLRLLNSVLKAAKAKSVSAGGLGLQ